MSELLERAASLLNSPLLEASDGDPSKFDWFVLRNEWLSDYSATPKHSICSAHQQPQMDCPTCCSVELSMLRNENERLRETLQFVMTMTAISAHEDCDCDKCMIYNQCEKALGESK